MENTRIKFPENQKNIDMKNKYMIAILLTALSAAGCTIDERPELPEERVTDLKIIVTPGEQQNTYLLRTNRNDVIAFWDLGNGNTASGVNEVLAEYPFPGNYTVSLEAYGSNGKTNSVSVKLAVTTQNLELLDDPMYEYIAGTIGGDGKTWVLDSLRNKHLDLLNPNNVTESWWGWDPLAKSASKLYNDKATFILNGEKGSAFEYDNGGQSTTLNNETAGMAFISDGTWKGPYELIGGDYVVTVTPPKNMGWSLSQTGGRYYITFPSLSSGHGGYLFYFMSWETQYEVRAISDSHMKVFTWTPNGDGGTSLRALYLITPGTPSGNDTIEWEWSFD